MALPIPRNIIMDDWALSRKNIRIRLPICTRHLPAELPVTLTGISFMTSMMTTGAGSRVMSRQTMTSPTGSPHFVRIGTDAVNEKVETVNQYGHWYYSTGRMNNSMDKDKRNQHRRTANVQQGFIRIDQFKCKHWCQPYVPDL